MVHTLTQSAEASTQQKTVFPEHSLAHAIKDSLPEYNLARADAVQGKGIVYPPPPQEK
jgi:hypothetical protein